jgi:ATP-dependent RNA helicase SUPV3L1/SUV3
MNYKVTEKNNEVFFKYFPEKNYKKDIKKNTFKESPFGVLKDLNLS